MVYPVQVLTYVLEAEVVEVGEKSYFLRIGDDRVQFAATPEQLKDMRNHQYRLVPVTISVAINARM